MIHDGFLLEGWKHVDSNDSLVAVLLAFFTMLLPFYSSAGGKLSPLMGVP